jgi:septal ring factor EnvC (AmiA/AmiB activator)
LQIERKQKKHQDNMVQTILNFVKGNYKTLIKVAVGIFILYWVIYVLTPTMQMSVQEKQKIDSLNNMIKEIYKDQQKLDSNIVGYNQKIDEVDNHIDKIKGQKTIVKEIYHEEINRVDTYTDNDVDSFFSNRYK